MKKLVFVACALLIGGFAAQAQEDSQTVGATTTTTKVVTKKVTPSADQMNSEGNAPRNAEMKKVLAERKAKSQKIKAAKKMEAEMANKTGVTTSKARVVSKEKLEAEENKKRKKAGKIDN